MRRPVGRLRKFDPFAMTDELVRQVTIGRERELADLTRIVEENLASTRAAMQHVAVLAPRGTGKTFLLRLLGLTLAERITAGEPLLFLHMPEEQPDIQSPASLMREILRLMEAAPASANDMRWDEDDPEAWDRLTRALDEKLAQKFGPDRGLMVICLENIDELLRGAFKKPIEQRRLRGWLDRPDGRIMLIAGAATGAFDINPDKALFRFTKQIRLQGWSVDQTVDYLDRAMTALRGVPLSDDQRRKARAVAIFTGGSPRMATALAEIITADDVLSAADTLDGLIDNLNDYYRARLNDLGQDARLCLGKLLREGENLSQTELARRLGKPQSAVARAFKLLIANDMLIGERPKDSREILYRVADRVFAHYYRARILAHGAGGSTLAHIVELLVDLFTERERAVEAGRLYKMGREPDARVLIGTLPKLDPTSAEEYWWEVGREFIHFAREQAENHKAPSDVLALLRRLESGFATADIEAEAMRRVIAEGRDAPWARFAAGVAAHIAGQPDVALHDLDNEDIERLPESMRSVAWLGAALAWGAKRKWGEAIALSRRARVAADPVVKASAMRSEAFWLWREGRTGEAARVNEEALELSLGADDWRGASRAYQHLALLAGESRDIAAELKFRRLARDAADLSGDLVTRAEANYSLALSLFYANQISRSERIASQALNLAKASGNLNRFLDAAFLLEDVFQRLDRKSEALALAREMAGSPEIRQSTYLRARAVASLAFELAYSGGPENAAEGLALAQEALAMIDASSGALLTKSVALRAKLNILSHEKRYPERLDAARTLEKVARDVGYRELLVEAIEAQLDSLIMQNRDGEAIDCLKAVLASGDIFPSGTMLYSFRTALDRTRRSEEIGLLADLLTPRLANPDFEPWAIGAMLRLLLWKGDFPQAMTFAKGLLARRVSSDADVITTAIAATAAWTDAAPPLSDSFWSRAANQGAGADIAVTLGQVAESDGERIAFSRFASMLAFFAPSLDGNADAETPAHQILSGTLRGLSRGDHPGILRDVCDALSDRLPGRFEDELRVAREALRFEESGRDPAMLARLDPDVATLLRQIHPELDTPEPKPARRRTPRRTTKAG